MSSEASPRAPAILIICQLGPFPHYLSLFLSSCSRSGVDFLFVTDQAPPPSLPLNARWVQMGISDIESRATAAAGFQVHIANGYKLCDFRPAFGEMFSDLVEGYLYWGHVDTDVVLGDIASIIDKRLPEYPDVISSDENFWLSGALTIYKNNNFVNGLYKKFEAGQKAFAVTKHVGFDETCGRYDRIRSISEVEALSGNVSMTDIVNHLAVSGEITVCRDFHIVEPKTGFGGDSSLNLLWCISGLFDITRERKIALVHLIFAKSDPFFQFPQWSRQPERVKIDAKGIRGDKSSRIEALIFETNRIAKGITPFSKALIKRARSAIARRLG